MGLLFEASEMRHNFGGRKEWYSIPQPFLATGMSFTEDNFFTVQGWEDSFRMI